jgi:hypothetical protein
MKHKKIVISINASWNIVNFRRGLIAGLQRSGYDVVALAPPDRYSERFEALGVDYVPIEIDKRSSLAIRPSPTSTARSPLMRWASRSSTTSPASAPRS